jgi:transcriptional regulator with XRE-family HTH domain
MEKGRRSGKPAERPVVRLRSVLGLALEEYRQAKGLGLRELADKAGLDPAQLSRLERGHQVSAHAATLRKLAEVLEVEPKVLLQLAESSREQRWTTEGVVATAPSAESGKQTDCTVEVAIEQDRSIPPKQKRWLRECVNIARLAGVAR